MNIKKIATVAFKKKKLICICLNKIDWDKRLIGFLKKNITDNIIELQVINEYGELKNVKTIRLDKIVSIEFGGSYNNDLELLHNGKFKCERYKSQYLHCKKKQNLAEKLQILLDTKELCSFYFNESYSIGFISKRITNELCIEHVGYDGVKDGIASYDLNELTKIRYNSPFEARIKFLLQKKTKSKPIP